MIAKTQSITNNKALMGILCVLLATLGLSLKAIFIKLIYLESPEIDAVTILALRFVVALPFFMLILHFSPKDSEIKKIPFSRQQFTVFALLGMVGFYLSAILDFSALAYIPASLERLILFLYPTFVVIISVFMRPNEVTRHVLFALLISYIGVVIVFIDQAPQMTPEMTKGVLLVLAAAIVFAIYTVASVKYIKQYGSIRFTAYAMIAATAMTLIHAITVHGFHFLFQSLPIYSLILPMAIFSTVMPLILMAEGVKRMGASSASIVSTSGPVITIALAVVFLDEVFGLMQAMGGILIIMGVFFVARGKAKSA